MGIQVYQRDNLLVVSKACENGYHKYSEPGVSLLDDVREFDGDKRYSGSAFTSQ